MVTNTASAPPQQGLWVPAGHSLNVSILVILNMSLTIIYLFKETGDKNSPFYLEECFQKLL
jgi:hypothetical protein